MFKENGLILKKDTIVDFPFIEASNSTNSKKKECDTEARSTKKDNQWHFVYKTHVGVDKDMELIHTNITTSANVHDLTVKYQFF